MKTGINVADAMTVKPLTIGPETTISECAKKMQIQKVGSLVIAENDNLLGIITEKDFVDKVILNEMNPKTTKVKEVMTQTVHTIAPDIDLLTAIKKMAKVNVRRLPVLDDKKLIGFLTSKDILAIQPELLEILSEKFNLREIEIKPGMQEVGCSVCGR